MAIDYNANPKHNWRLRFHLQTQTGDITDPNGLCQLDGAYHFFHQHRRLWPDAAHGWAHWASRDLVSWEWMGCPIMPDCDLDFAARHICAAAFGAAGERCMALPVVVAVGGCGPDLARRVKAHAERIKVGYGMDEGVEMGPVIDAKSKEFITGLIDDAEAKGAEVVLDGRPLVIPGHEKGHFLGPTIVDNVPLESSLYTEEVFGPVLAIVHADTYEEAIAQVNSSPFGNGSAIFTNDGGVARRFELDVEAGMVGINVPIPTPVAYYSFGGWKESLLGDTHIHGPEGVKFYTRAKAVTSRWPSEKTYAATMSFQREE